MLPWRNVVYYPEWRRQKPTICKYNFCRKGDIGTAQFEIHLSHIRLVHDFCTFEYSLDGPFVEYKGNIPADDRGPILEKLKAAFQELLEGDIDTEIKVLEKEEAQQTCDRVKENYFNLSDFGDDPVRLVTVAGWVCPCGGTHVKSTGCLLDRKWGITGLKCKKGIVKIKYDQNWETSK